MADGSGATREADVSRIETDQSRGLYFWVSCREQLCSHVTKFTPNWCEQCGWAFASKCPAHDLDEECK